MQPTGTVSLDDALQAARWIAARPSGRAIVLVADTVYCVWSDTDRRVRTRIVNVGDPIPFGSARGVPLFCAPGTTQDHLRRVEEAYYVNPLAEHLESTLCVSSSTFQPIEDSVPSSGEVSPELHVACNNGGRSIDFNRVDGSATV